MKITNDNINIEALFRRKLMIYDWPICLVVSLDSFPRLNHSCAYRKRIVSTC